jgi:hypothetical protein
MLKDSDRYRYAYSTDVVVHCDRNVRDKIVGS